MSLETLPYDCIRIILEKTDRATISTVLQTFPHILPESDYRCLRAIPPGGFDVCSLCAYSIQEKVFRKYSQDVLLRPELYSVEDEDDRDLEEKVNYEAREVFSGDDILVCELDNGVARYGYHVQVVLRCLLDDGDIDLPEEDACPLCNIPSERIDQAMESPDYLNYEAAFRDYIIDAIYTAWDRQLTQQRRGYNTPFLWNSQLFEYKTICFQCGKSGHELDECEWKFGNGGVYERLCRDELRRWVTRPYKCAHHRTKSTKPRLATHCACTDCRNTVAEGCKYCPSCCVNTKCKRHTGFLSSIRYPMCIFARIEEIYQD